MPLFRKIKHYLSLVQLPLHMCRALLEGGIQALAGAWGPLSPAAMPPPPLSGVICLSRGGLHGYLSLGPRPVPGVPGQCL